MDKLIYFNKLFDIYKDLFTDNQKEIYRLYYEENLSLQEIADINKVSRSFISKTINQVSDKLEYYEGVLKNLYKKEQIDEILKLKDAKKIKNRLEKLFYK